jgi:hypothetical protein
MLLRNTVDKGGNHRHLVNQASIWVAIFDKMHDLDSRAAFVPAHHQRRYSKNADTKTGDRN